MGHCPRKVVQMSKTIVSGNTVKITGMKVGEGSGKNEWHVDSIEVHIDVTGATVAELLGPALGTSLRVTKIQPMLRKLGKQGVEAKVAGGPIKLTLKDLLTASVESSISTGDRVMSLGLEDFITLMSDYGMPRDKAIAAFNRKHGTNHPIEG